MKLFFKRSKSTSHFCRKWRLNKILIVVIGILILLSLNFFQKEVKNFFYLISAPIQKNFWRAGGRISGFFEGIGQIKELKKENEELKLKIQELLAENTSLQELKKENENLREALGIGLQKDFQLMLANIIGKDLFQDSILIDKGSKDGVIEDLPVITSQRVFGGKVDEVYKNFSRVMLISNRDSSFDAKIADSEVFGIVKGEGKGKVGLDLIPQDKKIKEGDLVITAHLSKIYPKGLLVGLIKKVRKSDREPFQKAEISSFFDIENIENVFLILGF